MVSSAAVSRADEPPTPPDPVVRLLAGGMPVSAGVAPTGSLAFSIQPAGIADSNQTSPVMVSLLPLDPSAMSLADWASIGVDPQSAASLLAGLSATQSLAVVLDADGEVLSVIVLSDEPDLPETGTFVVTVPPGTAPMAPDVIFEMFRRFLELTRPSVPTAPGPEGEV